MKRWLTILALGALAACGSKKTEAPKGSSFGQVLPGSASDAMLPYDTVSSAPPLDARQYDEDDAAPTQKIKPSSAVPEEADTLPDALAT